MKGNESLKLIKALKPGQTIKVTFAKNEDTAHSMLLLSRMADDGGIVRINPATHSRIHGIGESRDWGNREPVIQMEILPRFMEDNNAEDWFWYRLGRYDGIESIEDVQG